MEERVGRFSRQEEIANFISHFVGAILAGIMLTLMVVASAFNGSAWHIVTTSIFGTSMVILYFSSAVAHGLPAGKSKQSFFIIDQVAIFLLIAGTYTPLALIALHGAFGWVLFGVQWAMAIAGILLKVIKPNRVEAGVDFLGVAIYAIMGWMLLIMMEIQRKLHLQ